MSSSKISSLLNDSDDVFQTPTLKRKVRPPSPSAKRRKNSKNVKLSQSLLTQMTLSQKKPEKTIDSETQVFEDSVKTKSAEEPFTCPLCKKLFKNRIQGISHLKQCGKKKKIALSDLQRALKENCVTKTSKACAKESIETRNNLSLAAAISLSLTETVDKPEAFVDKSVYDSQLATLETFGFTSTSAIGKSGRKKSNRVSVLRSRSEDDRRKLISEKCAAILLGMEEGGASDSLETLSVDGSRCPVAKLWAFAGDPGPPIVCYVPVLHEYIAPNPGGDRSQEMGKQQTSFSLNSQPYDKMEHHESLFSPVGPQTREVCLGDWGKFIGCPLFSDTFIATNDGIVPVHKLVLAACCPSMNIDRCNETRLPITSAALLSMLRYIYTNQLGYIEESMLNECANIARTTFYRMDLAIQLDHKIAAYSLTLLQDEPDTLPASPGVENDAELENEEDCMQTEEMEECGEIKKKSELRSDSDMELITLSSDSEDHSPPSQSLLSVSFTTRKNALNEANVKDDAPATPLNESIPHPEVWQEGVPSPEVDFI